MILKHFEIPRDTNAKYGRSIAVNC